VKAAQRRTKARRATITPATPAALTAIITAAGIEGLAAYPHGHAPTGPPPWGAASGMITGGGLRAEAACGATGRRPVVMARRRRGQTRNHDGAEWQRAD
jgi:hypothetical protein